MSYDIGDEVSLVGEFRVPNAVEPRDPGMLTSQSEVILQVKKPGFPASQFTLSLSQLTEISPGIYRRNIILDRAGRWVYRFTATGTYRGTSGDVVIQVDPSTFASV